MTLNSTRSATPRNPYSWRQRLLPSGGALLATLLSLPGAAVEYPDVPLQSGKAFPPANLMYIQDDSGSMAFERMPAEGAIDNSINTRSHVYNTIYYNPDVEYLPWMQASGARLSAGTAYTTAFSDAMFPSGSINLADTQRIFYFPKSGATNLTTAASYDRFRIYRALSGNTAIERCTRSNSNSITSTTTAWSLCTAEGSTVTPTGRSLVNELTNYATWYSYHRTRGKVAKAGASEAFNLVGENIRVGYDSIHNRSPSVIPVTNDGGLFRGANRTNWFASVQGSNASGNTPLRPALARTGNYFMQSGNSGPWASGPTGSDTQLSCRQNFAILTTDGHWNEPDSTTFSGAVGDSDGTPGPAITEGGNYNYIPVSPYRDNFSTSPNSRPNTLADVAMHYWKNDLRPDLSNDVASSTEDPAFWQHMVTFGVSIGLRGNLDPKSDLAAITNGSKRWGDPIVPLGVLDGDRIDDLWHASVNGRGRFIVASNTKEFAQGILDAIDVVAERQGSASNVTTNSTSFSTDTRVYQAKYVSGKWTGDLEAYDATAAGVATTPAWKASEQIPDWDDRRIFTWNVTSGAPFPTAVQTGALNQLTRITSPVNGANNADYIKGDSSRERRNGGELRNRDSLLGDIVNSSPTYVQDSETIFVGGNDGMLHAFAAKASGTGNNAVAAGEELFAYVPGGINLAHLASLSDPNYAHKYFVDGPVMVSSRAQTPGRNYLVGALGRGGKGLFGLDVTTPKSFSASDVKWELTTGANLGQILGESIIVTLNDVARTKAVIFGNGINSTSGRAVLYVVNIANGAVIQQIDTGVGGDNGMSAPRGWDDNLDGTVDYVYAGDLKGNLWKFDFTSTTGAGTIAFSGSPMFSSGTSQPITSAVALARDPDTGKRWVFVGTGSFISTADLTSTTVQSMYGLIDEGTTAISKGELTAREIVITTTVNGRTVRGFEPNDDLSGTSRGWYVDLDEPTPGERVVNRPQVRGSVLIFASIIPPVDDPCDVGGTGFINAIDAFSGTSTGNPYFDANGDGVVNDEDRIDTGDGSVPVGSIDPGVGMPTLPTIIDNLVVVGGSLGNLGDVIVSPQSGPPRRTSWHEVVRD